MTVRRALPRDIPAAAALAARLGLDYPGLEDDELWVAVEAGETAGLVALKKNPDCLELCALGIDPRYRGQGLGKALVEALMAGASGDVHLATVIPSFFEGCGFRVVRTGIPATFPARRLTDWCAGCPQERCTVMVRSKA